MLQHILLNTNSTYLNFSDEQSRYFLSIFYLQVLVEDDIECLVETNTMEQIHEPIKLYEITEGSGTIKWVKIG